MKRLKRLFIVIIILGIILLISNPSIDKHHRKIVEKFKQENPISGHLGAGDFITKAISYNDYYLFSISRISPLDAERAATTMGNTWVNPKPT